MGHNVEGFIGALDLISLAPPMTERSMVAKLRLGYGLVVLAEYSDATDLTPQLADFGLAASRRVPMAFIRTEYFGGIGEQAACAWIDGAVAVPFAKSKSVGPINSALRAIGVIATTGNDEFDSLGLGTYRSNTDWQAFARWGGELPIGRPLSYRDLRPWQTEE